MSLYAYYCNGPLSLQELLACLEHASVVFDGPDSNAAIVLVQWANPMKEMLVENTGVGCIPAVVQDRLYRRDTNPAIQCIIRGT